MTRSNELQFLWSVCSPTRSTPQDSVSTIFADQTRTDIRVDPHKWNERIATRAETIVCRLTTIQVCEWCPAPLLSTGHSTRALNDVHCVSILKERVGNKQRSTFCPAVAAKVASNRMSASLSNVDKSDDHTLSSRQIPESLGVTFLDVYKVCFWPNRQSIGVCIDGVGCAMYV